MKAWGTRGSLQGLHNEGEGIIQAIMQVPGSRPAHIKKRPSIPQDRRPKQDDQRVGSPDGVCGGTYRPPRYRQAEEVRTLEISSGDVSYQ